MIRFIVSDVDGTLLRNGDKEVSDRILEQIPELKEKGILFGVASGRNYDELKNLFVPVKNDILFITNNGAVVIFDEDIVCKSILERRLALDIIKDAGSQKNCRILVTGEKASYITKKDFAFSNFIKKQMKFNSIEVEELYKVREDMTKISVYQKGGVTEDMVEYFYKRWGDKTQIAVSDPEWIDFTAPYVNKGNAIAMVQHLYEISEEDTMTFGDHYNDIEMFEHSYFSYAMQDSHPDIRKAAKHIAPNVETIIEDVIRM